MPASTQKKSDKNLTPAAAAVQPSSPAVVQQAPVASAKAPALIAYYAVPVPPGQPSIATPIGAAVAHDDGEGFTLQLHLVPAAGGRIILRVPKAKKAE